MSARRPKTAGKCQENGYALLLIMFLVTVLLISTIAIAPNILTEGKREKEKEMIWRGKQYVRGVKLYYRKMGHFPTSIDDLTKPKTGSIRFMRQAYKDPMNTKDGSWRFIYVGAAGQLIGSLKPRQANLQIPRAAIGPGGSTPLGAGGPLGPGSLQGPGGTASGTPASGTNPPATTGAPVSADQGDAGSNPQLNPSGETPTIIGGNIIGVGSKINKPSVIVYEQAKNYRQFEFIWDPVKDVLGLTQPGVQTGTVPGQNPAGTPPTGQNPPNPPPAPAPPQPPQ